jgi:hypothetical protein
LAARRKIAHHDATKKFHRAASLNERLSGDDYSGSLANHIATGENAVVRAYQRFTATRQRAAAGKRSRGVGRGCGLEL